MKLLFALPEYLPDSGGGIITFYRDFLPALVREGHTVHVIAGSGFDARATREQQRIDGVSVERLELARVQRHFSNFSRYAALPGLRRLLAGAWAMHEQSSGGAGYDLVEVADWGLLFAPWIVEPRSRIVVQLHGSTGQIDLHDPIAGEEVQGTLVRCLERALLASADIVQASSRTNAQVWQAQTGHDVEVILPAWLPHATSTALARTNRGLVLGRVQRWKGPEVLCRALAELNDQAPAMDWIGRDVPNGPQRTMGMELTAGYPEVWGQKIRHLPPVPSTQARQLQASAAFAVVPSQWDTFNFTCVESMAARTPVICSSGAGASELIDHGRNGLVFERGNALELADSLRQLQAMSAADRNAMGAAAQRTVAAAMHPDCVVPLRTRAFERAIALPQSSPLPAADWRRLAVEPSEAPESFAFLEAVPLKGLARHTADRLFRKLRGKQ